MTNHHWTDRLDAIVPLRGTVVELEPLSIMHHEQLCAVGLDEEIWRLGLSLLRTPDDMASYIQSALSLRAAGMAYPFAIVERSSGRAIGSTRFANVDPAHRRLEIGWTWLGRAWQRTAVNTEAKYLLLTTAFEELGCIRVEFKTDVLNTTSRAALRRIGAQEEGVLRQHMITSTGRLRDSVYFSILDREWPNVKSALEDKLARPQSA